MTKSERRRLLGVRLLVGGIGLGVAAIGAEGVLASGWGWLPAGLFSAYELVAISIVWPCRDSLS